ncbi:hypothetical protein [Leptospira sp. mild_001]|uniref:hypothetical protein n=1 Tax=Leptospira sp. mild_001 TaxID=2838238 RepID=UPI001E2E13FA|nr:hypothetical protein [Leptospira sp. mild_001]
MNRVVLENSAQRFPMGRVGKLSTTLSYGSRWNSVDSRVSHFDLSYVQESY